MPYSNPEQRLEYDKAYQRRPRAAIFLQKKRSPI